MRHRKLILSTNNENKVEEIRNILKNLPIKVLSKKDIGLGDLHVREDANSLEDNSKLKAKALASKTKYMVMADDSGLFVEALNGKPGVYSSRYGGEEGNDKRNNEKLLEEMKGIPYENRRAKFKTVISLINEDKEILFIQGECKGYIGFKLEGENGFGYDPLFIPQDYDRTFAQLGEEIKNIISHRAKALEEAKNILTKMVKDE